MICFTLFWIGSVFCSVVGASAQVEQHVFQSADTYLPVSPAAYRILEGYRINSCEQADEIRGYKPGVDFEAVFSIDDTAYRRVRLTNTGVEAELILTSGMSCGGLGLEFCGSGGCKSHIIFSGQDYQIKGGDPFLLIPELSYESFSEERLTGIIAWWGDGSHCSSQQDEQTDPIKNNDCLLSAQYDRVSKRLVFQYDRDTYPD